MDPEKDKKKEKSKEKVERRSITFLEPWGPNSWLVEYKGPYKNTRKPHVTLGKGNMDSVFPNQKATLSHLHKGGKGSMAVMWQVDGVKLKNGKPAHITVAYGSDFQVDDFQ
mmetsp:Transcript_24259/g.33304  ORF Transcript_24259/g.33304 Transcript_24259/m.33304 type:complete len:111 (+) Transcript_24259:98-430(+)|eukprot:CAMPEP_0201494664 /NCGR_PEP_ID=MMETSP0151_2-20130828/48919_1 /ASSEMBLY_ACC=CAM_ASM_000257 /TAXON_ID=200890 /ORGANISM="Paramoeba atlantica, Strain 621/1 / CCAP 1560/9" /LENGTH=110 /DNA_ID=CAMNT_0047883081 /DNA_START=15 /DNA_END=347 /DNA_ORIENTATION=+